MRDELLEKYEKRLNWELSLNPVQEAHARQILSDFQDEENTLFQEEVEKLKRLGDEEARQIYWQHNWNELGALYPNLKTGDMLLLRRRVLLEAQLASIKQQMKEMME